MSPEAVRSSETVESLKGDIDVLRLTIYKRNLLNYVSDLGLDMLSLDVYRVFGNLELVKICEGTIKEEEWKELPHLRKRVQYVGTEGLSILRGGFFRINEVAGGGYDYKATENTDEVLMRYAFISSPDFRRIEEKHWKKYDQIWDFDNPGMVHLLDQEDDRYLREAGGYVDKHQVDLLKGLRSDMEACLVAISGSSAAVDSK